MRCDQSISGNPRRHRPHGVTGNPDHEEDATEDEHLNRRGHTVWFYEEWQGGNKEHQGFGIGNTHNGAIQQGLPRARYGLIRQLQT